MKSSLKNKINKKRIYLIRLLFPKRIALISKGLIKEGKTQLGIKLLKETVRIHPKHPDINKMLGSISVDRFEWKKALQYFESIKVKSRDCEIIEGLSICYKVLGLSKKHRELEARKYSNQLQSIYTDQVDISDVINQSIKNKQWEIAIHALEMMKKSNTKDNSHLIKLSMVYQIVGEHLKARDTLQEFIENASEKSVDKNVGPQKMIIFDNGKTRIEFYKKTNHTNKIIMTFDSINMDWNEAPFSFKVLEKENVDIIAIRKYKKKTYQQDLSQFDFLYSVSSLVSRYNEKLSYGFSLGAYNALYFSSLLNFRIYAISPRLSIHPIYGRTKVIGKHNFNHNLSFNHNNNIEPIIVYDPKNQLDYNFVNKEILKAFPKTILIKTPYSGHGVAPFLLNIGQLKEFLLNVLDGKTPKYKRKNKENSSAYLTNLAKECIEHNKFNWALSLSTTCLELEPTNKEAVRIKGSALMNIEGEKEAYDFIKEKIKQNPKILTFRNILIDLYIRSEQVELAKRTLKDTIEIFGDMPSLRSRKKMLECQDVKLNINN